MLKTELIATLATEYPNLMPKDLELAVNAMLQIMINAIATVALPIQKALS